MKRFYFILISAFLIVFCFASCGENDSTRGNADTDAVSNAETDADTTEALLTDTEPRLPPQIKLPDHLKPLTGLGASEDLSASRPVAIMINNLRAALPQPGLSDFDILYECLVEGGITRLMGVKSDYRELGVVDSIRSCRHYYLDLVQNHDAIYIHAGGSNQGYIEVKNRDIDNLDGVNMYVKDMFYRDQDRLSAGYGYEHTLMTSGERIAGGIAYKKYRTELRDEFKGADAFNFVDYGTQRELSGGDALCLRLPYSKYQTVRFDYDKATKSYYRCQFENEPHVDGTSGEQISFTNVFVLFCNVVNLGDSYGHLDITTENENGSGYYLSGGSYEPITWSKPTADSPIVYYGADGVELSVNRGKTFVSIFPEYNRENIDFNYVVPKVTE